MLRFKITDFTAHQQIQNVLIKLWRLVTQLQYDIRREVELRRGVEAPPVKMKHRRRDSEKSLRPEGFNLNSGKDIEYSVLPVDLALYEQVMFIFKRALGVLFETDYYVAKKVVPGNGGD